MAARTLPGLGLKGFWGDGFDGWGDDNDANLRLLSAMVQGNVVSKVAATPGSPTNGDIHLFTAAHPTQAGKVAIRDNGAWVYVTPAEGWMFYNRATDLFELYTGADWVPYRNELVASGYLPGVNTASEVVFRHQFAVSAAFPINLVGSKFSSVVAATASAVYDIRKNGANVGTLTWAAAGTIPTVVVAAAQTFASGDVLDIVAPASPDTTLAGITATFLGSRT